MKFRTFTQAIVRGLFLANGKLLSNPSFEMTEREAHCLASVVLHEDREAVSSTLIGCLAEALREEWNSLPVVDF